MDVIVVGSGVSGLSSAIRLQEAGFGVHLLTREMPQQTTSAVAGAIWHPLSTVGDPRMEGWARATGRALDKLAGEEGTGVSVVPLLEPIPPMAIPPAWRDLIPSLRPAPAQQLPDGYTNGIHYETYLVETPLYMAYLLDRYRRAGGTLERRTVNGLDEVVGDSHTVVNCTGAWAGQVADDPRVYPLRGQILRLRPQPHLKHAFHVSGGPLGFTYIFPRSQDCVLGGTSEPNVWSRQPDAETSASIHALCSRVEPSLTAAEVIEARVGLRPGRDAVRLEMESRPGGRVIHNYGHGGIGFTLSWGCANEVATLARQACPS